MPRCFLASQEYPIDFLAYSAYHPIPAFLYDLVRAHGEIEFLIFVVVTGNDLAVAKHKRRLSVCSCLFTGETIEPRSDGLERIEFDQRVLFPFSAD